MEKRFRIKPKLSFTPSKVAEGVYRVRLGKRMMNLPQKDFRDALEGARGISLSPRKGKQAVLGLFRGARCIDATETYLMHDKTHGQSKTNESSTPQESHGLKQPRLNKPMGLSRNNRSMSNGKLEARRGKEIQRTVSIVIDGAKEGEAPRELMDTLSRIILQGSRDDFLIEFLGESSIHGQEQNYVEMDSRFLTEEVSSNDSAIIEI